MAWILSAVIETTLEWEALKDGGGVVGDATGEGQADAAFVISLLDCSLLLTFKSIFFGGCCSVTKLWLGDTENLRIKIKDEVKRFNFY